MLDIIMSEANKVMRKSFDFSIESLLKTDFKSKKTEKSSYLSSIGIEYDVNSHTQSLHFVNSESNNFANPLSPFSREEISSSCEELNMSLENQAYSSPTFSWLNCTRFKPPKLPRSRKRGNLSKRLGRGPRIPFSPQQIAVLENTFNSSQYLSSDCICRLALLLHLSETRVKIWFQNRRARYRRERDAHEKAKLGLVATIGNEHNNNKLTTMIQNSNRSIRKRSSHLSQLASTSPGHFMNFPFSGHDHQDHNDNGEESADLTSGGLITLPHLITQHTHYPQLELQEESNDDKSNKSNLYNKEKKFSLESCEDSMESPEVVGSASTSPSPLQQSEFPLNKFSHLIRDSTSSSSSFSNLELNINALNSHLGLSLMNLTKESKLIGNNLSLDASSYQIYKSIYP